MEKVIAKRRKALGLSQQALANTLGVSQATVAMWETGDRRPRTSELPKLAQVLECTIDELFGV